MIDFPLATHVDAALRLGTWMPDQHVEAVRRGAECWRCPLLDSRRGPVPPSLPDGYTFLVVAEAPGVTEVKTGTTLIGASGREVRTALREAGADMNRTGFTNTIMCQPEGGDLKRYLRDVKRQGLDSPIDCCRPRLTHELTKAKFALLMGGASLQGVGISSSVMSVRGTPVQIPNGPRAVPTPHAAFVLRDEGRSFRPIFRADIKKAVRISRGGDTWRDPVYFVARSADEIDNFLAVPRPFVAVDTETDGVDEWTCNLRRIGIGTGVEVMIYSPLSVQGHYLLPEHERQAQTRAIAARLPHANTAFHNFYGYDSAVLARHGVQADEAKMFDTLIGHRIGPTSELPHRLDFLGSLYTDGPYWKQDVKHSNVKSDDVLDKYLAHDVAVTALSAPYVKQNLVGQEHIYMTDVEMSRVGRSMSALGIWIDSARRAEFALEYQKKEARLLAEFRSVTGRDVNPNSPKQMQQLLYHDLGLTIMEDHMTESGEASTDENTLLDLLSIGVDKRAEKVIHAIIGCREAGKILGTYTGRVENGVVVGGPPVHSDGRLRTGWNPGKVTGRWSSGDPCNLTAVPKKLRAQFRPRKGKKFVGADMSALELRILALLSKDQPMLDAFAAFDAGKGPDVHTINACRIFRCEPAAVTDEVRTFCKRVIFGRAYGAQAPKIYQTLSLMRTDDLRPLFPHITLQEVERFLNLWTADHPAVTEWQKKLLLGYRAQGFLESPWHRRRRHFIGGENPQEEVNFPIQSGAADLQNSAVAALVAAYPFDFGRGVGLVLQVHDQLVVECPEADAERVKTIIEQSMTRRIDGLLFSAKAKIGDDWKEIS